MKTDTDRLRFAVKFSSENLRRRALNRVRRELTEFLGMTPRGTDSLAPFGMRVSVTREPYPWNYPEKALVQLQRDAKHLLEGAGSRRGVSAEIKDGVLVADKFNPTLPVTIFDSAALSRRRASPVEQAQLALDVATMKGRTVRLGTSTRAGFLLVLAFLLIGEAGARVRRCPECGRAFIRVGRQVYCRNTCTDKATWRNYPAEKKRLHRLRQYKANGWTYGARMKGIGS